MSPRDEGRGRGRGHGGVRGHQRAEAEAREALERRWYRRHEAAPALEALVTARAQKAEPIHRWIPYRQGFAPELVRRFLAEGHLAPGPVLDPFAGSGTTVIECARQGAPAIGLEAEEALAFAASAAFGEPPAGLADAIERAMGAIGTGGGDGGDGGDDGGAPEADEVRDADDASATTSRAARGGGGIEAEARALAPRLADRAQRAALLVALARTLRADGSRRADLPRSLRPLFDEALADMQADLAAAARASGGRRRAAGLLVCGDARRLPVRAGSIGGVLTSPPYLSRFDYGRITSPLERVLAAARGGAASREAPAIAPAVAPAPQLPAFRQGRAPGRLPARSPHPVASEVAERLRERHQPRAAKLVLGYFDGLDALAAELARVLRPEAPVWVVLGGALVYDVLVPADLVLAELLEQRGLEVEAIHVARELSHSTGKRLGALEHNVRPRESLIQARKG